MATKKELLALEVARTVGAGRAVALETVDFNDPNRPKTCLEVDFPILPVNQVAIIEGNAGKPIYQMSKWWARRRSSVFRCRKRTKEPKPVSWGRMRREVMADVRQLQAMLENHAKAGLPAADLQVIRRGKALEYFSRPYGKVYVDEGRTISVRDALVGINQLIDEHADKGKEPPPVNAEPITRQFLRTFSTASEIKRDQLQKFMRGTITAPDDFVQCGWCAEKNKVFNRMHPLDFAREWSGRHRRRLTADLDQALVLIGACFDGSGINAADTLKNEHFQPHVALKPLLVWLHHNGPDQATRNAAARALSIYQAWAASQAAQPVQGSLFEEYER